MEEVAEMIKGLEIKHLLLKIKPNHVEQNLVKFWCLKTDLEFYNLDFCQHFVWEKLNTGHWKDVDETWRHLYAVCLLLKVKCILNLPNFPYNDNNVDVVRDLVKMADMSLLMGAPILNGFACKLATKMARYCDTVENQVGKESKRLKLEQQPLLPVPKISERDDEVDGVEELCLEDFLENFKLLRKPVLVKGLLSSWPCMSPERKWSVDLFQSSWLKYRSVPVELGSRYTDQNWTQTIMTIQDFVDEHIMKDNPVKGYLAQHQLFDQIPELLEDLEVPELCFTGEEDEEIDINSWFGPAGTVSPLHTDPKNNFLCQVFGQKYVKLYNEDQSEYLYPFPEDQLLSNTSQVDLENWDEKSFPNFAKARGLNCVLVEGDALYIPPKCWHFVKSLSPSFSASFWFQ